MADLMVAVATGLCAVFLFLLTGLIVYLLWKKKQNQRQYQELINFNPAIPSCTPMFQTLQGSSYGSSGVPFFLPPRFENSSHVEGTEGREEEEQWDQHPHLHNHRGSLTVGSWFPLGNLRPDLYQLPEEPSEWAQPSGSTVCLCFAVQYQQEREQLMVSLLQAANLPVQCQGSGTLVKLQLMPTEDRHHRQAKARCKGCHSQFSDSFVFQLTNNRVDQCTLRMSMYIVDRLKKHHLLGHILFPLSRSELHETAGKVLWRDLETDCDLPLSKHGNIQVSLNYIQSLQRLTVVVLRARGLQCLNNADVSVQVSLQVHTEVVKIKWTSSARGNEPTFNEKLTFRLLPLQLDAACLSLLVQQLTMKELVEHQLATCTNAPLSLGLVVIGPFMYARGKEMEHWNDMVSKSPELVKQWHGLGAVNPIEKPV